MISRSLVGRHSGVVHLFEHGQEALSAHTALALLAHQVVELLSVLGRRDVQAHALGLLKDDA